MPCSTCHQTRADLIAASKAGNIPLALQTIAKGLKHMAGMTPPPVTKSIR